MERSTYRITAHLDISAEMEQDRHSAELVLAAEEYIRRLNVFLESDRRLWWSMVNPSGSETAKITEPIKLTGLVVRDTSGKTLIRSGSALTEDG